jgi:hypothetical protein
MTKNKQFFILVLSLFFVSLAVCGLCYWGAWQGGFTALVSMFGMTMWIGLCKFIQKALKEAFDV